MIKLPTSWRSLIVSGWFSSLALSTGLLSAEPTVEQALSLMPMQQDVDFDRPSDTERKGCTVKSESMGTMNAWVVYSASGDVLRRFVDSNADNKVDLWCYAKNGVEVYRDVDADFNGKADQYRWLGTGGIRLGTDDNEDGKIDSWKRISAEEVSAEVVAALRDQDAVRFAALLMSPSELESLHLGTELTRRISEQIAQAKSQFVPHAQRAKVAKQAQWLELSVHRPGAVPAADTADDVIVYENAVAMISTDGQHAEVPIGTLVKVDDTWRLIGVPDGASHGFFFTAADRNPRGPSTEPDFNPEVQDLVKQLEVLDAKLSKVVDTNDLTSVNKDRATILRQLADATKGNDRDVWLLQLVDAINAAAQSGGYPDGATELKKLYEEIAASTKNDELIAQSKFCYLTAEYSSSLQAPNADYAKLQEQWHKSLQDFVDEFPQVSQAAEAMLQLAIAEEFAGNFDRANQWYAKIIEDFPKTDLAEKAVGARRRLDSVGKSIRITGRTLSGKDLDLALFRGRFTLVHYWATWCEPCKQDIAELRKIQAKHAKQKFEIVGINLDNDPQAAIEFLRVNRIPWEHIHESGGLDSSMATNMGVFTLPVMLLIDKNGTVMNRSITVAELDSELTKRAGRR
jgi:thiol-disulfide isomerase/thioredoxin